MCCRTRTQCTMPVACMICIGAEKLRLSGARRGRRYLSRIALRRNGPRRGAVQRANPQSPTDSEDHCNLCDPVSYSRRSPTRCVARASRIVTYRMLVTLVLLDFSPHSSELTPQDTCPLSVRIVALTNVSTWLGRQLHLFHLSDTQSIGDHTRANCRAAARLSARAAPPWPPSSIRHE